MTTSAEALALALGYHRAGDFREAEQIYRQLLDIDPQHLDARYLLGVLAHQVGRSELAIEYIGEILRRRPDFADGHNTLGEALRQQGRLEEALASFQEALRLRPDFPEAHYNLGNVWKDSERPEEAAACYRRALDLRADYSRAHLNLGNVLESQGQTEEAIACYRRALQNQPDYAEAYLNLGSALQRLGQLEEAIACCRHALLLRPDFFEAHHNLGNALADQGLLKAAIASYQQALTLQPDSVRTYLNLGTTWTELGHLDEAITSLRQALDRQPDYAEAHRNLGFALMNQGRLDEAEFHYREACRLRPAAADVHDNLLVCLNYAPHSTPASLLAEQRSWADRHAPEPTASHPNSPEPDRRLRIGYVSGDFRDNVIGANIWPLLRHHDPIQFQITLYANQVRSDALTDQFRACAHQWRPVVRWSDDRVAQQIRDDRIDILVDLALHTAYNRLLVFARKAAPVQVTFAGYPGGTGLAAIDYRLTDPYLDPPGTNDSDYVEASYRLPHSYWCFDPRTEEPAVEPLPALTRGFVAFGCLNHFCKVNDGCLRLWARVLREVKASRLLLLAMEGGHRQRTVDFLAREGIAGDRIEFFFPGPRPAYLRVFHQVDIGLDALPYNGHTSSLDALWMGVPVVSLVGQTVVGRAGLSQLTNLGLEELAVFTPDEFVQRAVGLAGDLPRLADLRSGLRERMRQSPLMDATGFTRGIEEAYRVMWRKWCETKKGSGVLG